MAAAQLELELYWGETWIGAGTHRASSAGAVIDISGWTIVLTLKHRASDTDVALTVNGAIVSGPSGTYTVTLTAAQTRSLQYGDYHCDIWRTNAGSETLMGIGRLTVLPPIKTT